MTDAYTASEGVKHILVTGFVGMEPLKNFCGELFDDDHGNFAKHAVIMQNNDPKPQVIMYML